MYENRDDLKIVSCFGVKSMKTFLFLVMACLCTEIFGNPPPATIPEELYDDYTLNARIPVTYRYSDQSNPTTVYFTTEEVDDWLKKAKGKKVQYYGWVDNWLFGAMDKYIDCVRGKTIGVIGSTCCWYESVVLSYGGKPITVEYNPIMVEDSRLQAFTVEEFNKNPIEFDAIVSISSIEHDGLGRYGDPLSPNADIAFMQRAKRLVKKGGLFFLAVPVGMDEVVFNWHRVYGEIRLPLLLDGWELLEIFGDNHQRRLKEKADMWGGYQPIFVLRNPII